MLALGIETSCDETACGVVDSDLSVRANTVYSQIDRHALYGGVVPEIAARAHLEKLAPIVRQALGEAGTELGAIDLIAFTRGPGLLGPLLVGASFARALGKSLGKPVWGLNHLEGHVASAFVAAPDLAPPFLCLIVSGGHTELWKVDAELRYIPLGSTRDDAAGEAFDKCGKLLGLGYPAGPQVARMAESGDPEFVRFPQAMAQRGNLEFSFSGLKTAVLRFAEEKGRDFLQENIAHVCASLQSAVVEVLVRKAMEAVKLHRVRALAVVGGVSANRHLRMRMQEETSRKGVRCVFPPLALCGDNGAMIAAAAQLRAARGAPTPELDVRPGLGLGE